MPEILKANPRILVVDDDPDIRTILKMILTGGGFEVTLAADGEAGWKSASENPPDLLLTDIMMPGLDGFELLQRVRADPRTRSLPVILLSAKSSSDDVARGVDLGADEYLTKPCPKAELLAKVRWSIDRSALLVK
jgi:DNA-binding response OmpR family regulator